jgi:hypothetical protein
MKIIEFHVVVGVHVRPIGDFGKGKGQRLKDESLLFIRRGD